MLVGAERDRSEVRNEARRDVERADGELRVGGVVERDRAWQLIEANTPALGTPTHAVVVGREIYFIGNSGWDNFTDEGPIKPGATFQPPQILKVPLTH